MSQRSKKKSKKSGTQGPSNSDDAKAKRSAAGPETTCKTEAAPTSEIDAPNSGWRLDMLFALILLVTCLLRFIALDIKPPHFDEGINGFFVMKMWKDGYYHYDPSNFHGPLYFYILQMAEIAFGRSIISYRFINGCLSLASVIAVARHRRFFGRSAIWAAGVLAISTGMVFYSRYAIHETLFILCQILFSYGFFAWREKRTRAAIGLLVGGFFGAVCVKETFFIFFVVWAIAAVMSRFWEVQMLARRSQKPLSPPPQLGSPRFNDWIVIGCFGFFVTVALFTGFFLNPQGYADMFAAFTVWTKTGTGNSGHEKPFMYWLQLLQLYEWPALVSLVITIPLFFLVQERKRLLVLVAFGTWLCYSIIPYKTPWLIINLLWPLSFVFGFAIEQIKHFHNRIGRIAAQCALVVCVIASSVTMLRLNFRDYTKKNEPYVYVQSTEQMKLGLEMVHQRLHDYPEDLNMAILVLVKDPWPLPWVFSMFPKLTYGKAESVELKDAGVILIDAIDQSAMEARLHGPYWRIPFQIRDSYSPGFGYLDFEKFKAYVPSDSAVVKGQGPPYVLPTPALLPDPHAKKESEHAAAKPVATASTTAPPADKKGTP